MYPTLMNAWHEATKTVNSTGDIVEIYCIHNKSDKFTYYLKPVKLADFKIVVRKGFDVAKEDVDESFSHFLSKNVKLLKKNLNNDIEEMLKFYKLW